MSDLEEGSGKNSSESKAGSKPRTVAKARSKPSTVKVTNVQLLETVETDSKVVTQYASNFWTLIKFLRLTIVLSVLLRYGMSQHDDTLLLAVLVSTLDNRNGNVVKVLLKLLEANLPKS